MRSSSSKYSLFVVAALVLALSSGLWIKRARHASQDAALQERQRAQHAAALLFGAFHADNFSTYTARSTTMALYGGQSMNTVARITRAPHGMAIVYEQGAQKGLQCGFSERWFWRQSTDAVPMQAYAEVKHDANEMAAQRFALMMDNYAAELLGEATIDGRLAEIVQLRPWRPIDGARGPAKQLWIDRQSGLTLRVDTFNYRMQPIMRSTLAEVQLNPTITDKTFEAPRDIAKASQQQPWVAEEMGGDWAGVAAKIGINAPRVTELPPGFHFDGVGLHRCKVNGAPCKAALSRYTDGLNTLTVFAMKSMPDLPAADAKTGQTAPSGDYQFGSGTLVTRKVNDAYLVAVADLPPQTLHRTLASVRIDASGADAPTNAAKAP